jgi:hypothetical protein
MKKMNRTKTTSSNKRKLALVIHGDEPKQRLNINEAYALQQGQLTCDPRPRYFSIAAITDDARPISTQVFTNNLDEVVNVLRKWCTPAQEQWQGRIIAAAIYDSSNQSTFHYCRRGMEFLKLEGLS